MWDPHQMVVLLATTTRQNKLGCTIPFNSGMRQSNAARKHYVSESITYISCCFQIRKSCPRNIKEPPPSQIFC